jgi:hypothetical protein
VKICGITYELLAKTAEEMQGRIGLANFNTQEVWVGDHFTKQTQHIARMHEVLHIISDAYNLNLTEEQVKFLTHALIAFFEDNPDQTIFARMK